ncbi:MAG: YhgE/Pip family protein [Lactococcus raffinolactis]|uniref:YhgE/Pip family protein n=1 Tax=Pseudolactococcus raffinolactis TaxID=1366 RepID=UPI0039911ED5
MIKKEWQAILKNKFFIVIIVALATIPALYNLIFLSSMWDPYGKISDLPVAVVNEDKSATVNGKTVNLGDDLVDELGKSHDLDYHFVSNKTAQKGLKDDKYYMQITIPSDFSKNAGSLVSNDPMNAVIHYQTSVGHNFIASKMSDSAMEKLKEKVSENITKTYTKTIFENLTTLSDGVTKAADGSAQLVNGSGELKSGADQIAINLDKLSSSSLTFKDGAETLNVGLGKYTAGVSTLATGANDLSQAVTNYTNGATQIANGNSQLNAASGQLSAGLSEFSTKTQEVDKLVAGSQELSQGLSDLSTGLDVSKQITALQTQLGVLNTSIQNYNNDVQSAGIPDKLQQDFTAINTALQQLVTQEASKMTELKATAAYTGATPDEQTKLESLVSLNPTETQAIQSTVTDLQTQITALQGEQTKISGLATGSNSVLSGSNLGLTALKLGIEKAKTGIDTGILPGAQQISTGTAQLKNELTTGATKLTAGVSQFSAATAKLNTGAQNLVSNNAQLTAGAAKLATGANQLNQNSGQLIDGSGQLANGAGQISNGSTQLATGANTLTTGIGTLQNGATTLASGLGEAKTKLAENQTNQSNAEKIAKPLKINHSDKDNSPKNGVGMAPYMMSVALFVGAVATNMIIAGTLSGEKAKNRRDYILGRLAVNGVIAVGEGVLVFLAVHVLGLSANHEFAMFGFTILVAFTFMFIVTFFNTWLGKPGAFLMLILLLLQLAASAGTYPLALTGSFFQKINPWMPMTYAVTGFRQVISLAGHIGHETGILLILSIVSVVLLAFVGIKKEAKTKVK